MITATATRFSDSEWDIEMDHDEQSAILFEPEGPDALAQFLEQSRLSIIFTLETS
ncbi:hypothetical protein [Shewanella sp. UCD-KL12]|uniref:hypothetical protein n=1 Tax=Shewanella sp. UCD-KL12 TaxID=1917163 RepID=UPI0015C40D0B|nr:hypothetical protein [Shewanella sp. UCD-KL12]